MTNPKRIPDDELMMAAKAGDDDAFTTLYRRWHREVFRYQFSRLGKEQAADEATCNTFSVLFETRERYTAEKPFRRWLFGIAKYSRLNLNRWRIQRPTVALVEPPVDREPRALEVLVQRETAELVRRRAGELVTPGEADAINGLFYAGKTGREIAHELRVSPQSVYQRANTALNWMREDAALAALV